MIIQKVVSTLSISFPAIPQLGWNLWSGPSTHWPLCWTQSEQRPTKIATFEFSWLLGKSLIVSHVHCRFQNRHDLPADLVQNMMNVLGIKNIPGNIQHCQDAEAVEGRCGVCVHAAKTSGNYKKAIHQLNYRLKVKCMKCKTFLYKNHQNNVATCPSYPNCMETSDSKWVIMTGNEWRLRCSVWYSCIS